MRRPSPSSAVAVTRGLISRPRMGAQVFLLFAPCRSAFCFHNGSRACVGRAAAAKSRSRPSGWPGVHLTGLCYPAKLPAVIPCSRNDDAEVAHAEDVQKLPNEATGAEEPDAKESTKRTFASKELMEQLKRYGVAGFLSYGLLNTFYYLVTFLTVWFYFLPEPGKMGYAAAVERFIKVMAAVWAGSQVTKLLRAGGALALAPFVDKGLSWFTVKFKFQSKAKAFAAIAGTCFGLAFILFLTLTLLWA